MNQSLSMSQCKIKYSLGKQYIFTGVSVCPGIYVIFFNIRDGEQENSFDQKKMIAFYFLFFCYQGSIKYNANLSNAWVVGIHVLR
jgi:hypothetical protein